MKPLALLLLIMPWATSFADDEQPWRPLYDQVDESLQAALEAQVDSIPAWRALARRKQLAIGVVDLNGERPRFARVNGRHMMYAASLPKIAILLGAYVALDEGTLEDTPELRADLTDMIRRSSNAAATRNIDRVGMDRINRILRDPRYELYDDARGGGLWVGRAYAKRERRIGDPMHGISHGATVTQICRFYYLLANGRLVSPARSEQMLQDLVDPGLHHKFVASLDNRAPKAKVYRKSGTWRNYHSDSVMVRGTIWRNYILAAMVESPDGEAILRKVVPVVESILQPAIPEGLALGAEGGRR